MNDNRLDLDSVTNIGSSEVKAEKANKEVKCLGKTFASDDERREYFREELRKKLPELKKMEGFPIGEDDDIINLSDPPYYTACPNPWLNDFISDWEKEKKNLEAQGKRRADFEVRTPYASDVSEGKNNPIYMAHAYHTKVPHPAIMRYILHYTQPGDVVFDGFAGTGMTGVAAQMCGKVDIETKMKIEQDFQKMGYKKPVWGKREAILGDLSPIACFIAKNYNSPLKKSQFESIANSLLKQVKSECGWMYETKHTDGSIGTINYVLLSDIFICDNCGCEVDFWKASYNETTMTISEQFECPNCGKILKKKTAKRCYRSVFDKFLNKSIQQAKIVPALINYEDSRGKTHFKKPDADDIKLINRIENLEIPYFVPHDALPTGFNTRQPLQSHGFSNVHHFYSKRTLYVLSCIWNKFPNWYLRMPVTAVILKTASLLHNVGFKDGKINLAGALPNVLFVPSVKAERNIITLIEGKIKDFIIDLPSSRSVVQVNSATSTQIKNDSVDYIFTDPPFGANIMYSELNFIHESWLKVKTNNKEEAIENDVQEKGLLEYQGLMQKCFEEYYRILKPGCWMTVEFSNTAASVWNGIQLALNRAGFVIANVAALDKQQGSFKAQTSPTAVKQDLVISCYKPSETFLQKFTIQDSQANIWSFVEEQLSHLPMPTFKDGVEFISIVERSPKVLYDRLITFFLMRGLPVPIDATDFQEGLRSRFVQEDGMVFTRPQLAEYADVKQKNKINPSQISMGLDLIVTEGDAIAWLNNQLNKKPQKYQDLQPDFLKANMAARKGENPIELKTILEENYIQQTDGSWRVPNMNEAKDREALRNKALLKLWDSYCKEIDELESKGKRKKIKEVRLEAVKAGFKKCFQEKDFVRIKTMGDSIPENILTEDETLLNYYDIACTRV